MKVKLNQTDFELVVGDITRQPCDAIVNAANSRLAGGGGVDGAIHSAGGPAIMRECDVIRQKQGGCPAGEAVITTAGDLPCRYVIHTVGPVYHDGHQGEADTLAACYRNSLELAADHKLKSIFFASISTGIYGYPVEMAAGVALPAIINSPHLDEFDTLGFVLFSENIYRVYSAVLQNLI